MNIFPGIQPPKATTVHPMLYLSLVDEGHVYRIGYHAGDELAVLEREAAVAPGGGFMAVPVTDCRSTLAELSAFRAVCRVCGVAGAAELGAEVERLRAACRTILRHLSSHQVYDKDSERVLRDALASVPQTCSYCRASSM